MNNLLNFKFSFHDLLTPRKSNTEFSCYKQAGKHHHPHPKSTNTYFQFNRRCWSLFCFCFVFPMLSKIRAMFCFMCWSEKYFLFFTIFLSVMKNVAAGFGHQWKFVIDLEGIFFNLLKKQRKSAVDTVELKCVFVSVFGSMKLCFIRIQNSERKKEKKGRRRRNFLRK